MEGMEVQNFNFQKLTPRNDIALGIYEDAIEYAFSNNDICNIAISGAYGAGKSSVIESYKRQHPDRKFMHISLAHFTNMVETDDEIPETQLEGKIINQLIHQIPPEKIPQTNFAIKKEIDVGNILKYSIFIMVFFTLCCFIILHNAWCNIIEQLSNKQLMDFLFFTTKKEILLISIIVCFGMLFYACYEVIKQQMNRKIFKMLYFTANNFNIELFGKEDMPYFDKYLNEVIYLFENTGVDAVVFEDLDRYGSNLIFEKLREINTLLNRKQERFSDSEKKAFRFIFLLKDDIFTSKDRTKFFDYIIPVIPVINGSNANDIFIEYFNQNGIINLFETNFLQEISLYVDDIRILKNIVNEFLVYYEKINTESTELNNNKLLAMIIYKNVFPRDFVELQTFRGYVYQLFQNKDNFIKRQIEILQDNIEKLEKIEKSSNRELCKSLDELDAIFYVDDKPTRVNDMSVDEFSSRADYVAEIKKNEYSVKMGEPYYYEYKWTDVNVKDKFDALLSNQEYKERKQKIENKADAQKVLRQSKLSGYKKELEYLKYAYLKDIITRENEDDIFALRMEDTTYDYINIFAEIKNNPYFPLIKYLIRNGYIDETYPDYMTFFYPNSISRRDKIFLRSITDKNAKDHNYVLDDARLVISKIRITDFEEEECWNYNLLDALLENPEDYKGQIKHFMYGLWNWEPAGFVDEYIGQGKNVQTFVSEFNKEYNNAVSWILHTEHISEDNKRQYVLATLYGAEKNALLAYNNGGGLVNYINQCDDFLTINSPNVTKIIDGFKALGIQFASINFETANKELLWEVYSNNMYQLTQKTIYYCLEYMYQIPVSEKYKTQRLTLILSKEQPLAGYVKDNLEAFINIQIQENDRITEHENTVIYVLNEESLNRQIKSQYIGLLKTKLPAFSTVTDKELWKELLPNNIADDSNNIFDYFYLSGNGMDDKLISYINNYTAWSAFDIAGLDEKYGEDAEQNFFFAFIESNNISNDKYRQLLLSFNLHIQIFSTKGISRDKMQILIQDKIIDMSLNNLHFLRENYEDSVNIFVEENVWNYVDIMTTEELVEEEVAHVLQMDIKDKLKIQLLELETEPISVMHKNYSSKVIVYILQYLLDINEKEQLYNWYPDEMPKVQDKIREIALNDINNIILDKVSLGPALLKDLFRETEITLNGKKMLLAYCMSNLQDKDVKDCLDILDLKDFSSLLEGESLTFEVSSANEELLTAFQDREWISHFETVKEDETLYIAYGCKPKTVKIS